MALRSEHAQEGRRPQRQSQEVAGFNVTVGTTMIRNPARVSPDTSSVRDGGQPSFSVGARQKPGCTCTLRLRMAGGL